MLATEKNIKKLMVEIYNDFVSDFLFDIEYNQYGNDERGAFRVYIKNMENRIRCTGNDKDEFVNKMIQVHDQYLDHCVKFTCCSGCAHKEVFMYKGACFKPFVEQSVRIKTPVDSIIRLGKGCIIAFFAGLIASVLIG